MRNLRSLLLVRYVVLLFGVSGLSFVFWKEKFAENLFTQQDIALQKEDLQIQGNQPLVLRFVGDIMLDRGVAFHIQKNGSDWKWPFLNIAKELQETDFLFGNLESIISDKGKRVGSIYSFRANPLAIEGLQFAGFDMLSVANNHSFDYGRIGFEDSLSRLKEAGIVYGGVREVKGTKIVVLAYTTLGSPLWNDVPWIDLNRIDQLQTDIARAKTLGDIVIVSFHWGDEYITTPNDFQKILGRTAIDAGANIVVGHHPHVVQPLEQYKNGWIAYSLGNFVFDQNFSEETMRGAILRADVRNNAIQNAVLEHTTLNDSFQVKIVE